MKIGVLQIGEVDSLVVNRVCENVDVAFGEKKTEIITKTQQIPREAYSEQRQQYRSDIMLKTIRDYAEKEAGYDSVLGIVDVDIFVPRMSFVFGQAEVSGRVALISLWRLKPEFYKRTPSLEVVIQRATKEAIHELGHTLGLKHCSNPYCVMYFSNSIFETDRKRSLFCDRCFYKTQTHPKWKGEET